MRNICQNMFSEIKFPHDSNDDFQIQKHPHSEIFLPFNQVLDARDPIGSRCRDIELRALSETSQTTATTKKIILVLNKIGNL